MTSKAIPLQFGGPIPRFEVRSPIEPRFRFDTVAGRYVVLSFLGAARAPASLRFLEEVWRRRELFDDTNLAFFGVSADPDDEHSGRLREALPGVHFLWDFDHRVSRLFGASRPVEGAPAQERYVPMSLLLDERLRVVARVSLGADPERHMAALMAALATLPPLDPALPGATAPVLSVPRVFEPALCQALIRYYEEHGGGDSGFMQDVDGKTVGVIDPAYKRRKDREIADEPLRKACMARVYNRLLPELSSAFQFEATRIERYMVACYEAEAGGHFSAHRDNTTKGTAHRRFAVSLVLNSDFEGGGLRFPEFGRQRYSPAAGGALVFSCSLLHEVTPVTQGKRYAFLPFLYDEAAARQREQNLHYLDGTAPSKS